MVAKGSSTWLITGASSGIGKALALESLKSGHKVIGTTRDVQKAKSSFAEFSSKGGIWVQLDPAHKDSQDEFAKCCQEHDVDVLVNNAGYAFIGGIEDSRYAFPTHWLFLKYGLCAITKAKPSDDEVRTQMEVNFYGPLRAVKACLPIMRAKNSGNLVLISSAAGLVNSVELVYFCRVLNNGESTDTLAATSFIARPARGSYSASKFAIEAIHESLAQEVNTFGIKVLIVEPGAFQTPFANRVITPARYMSNGGFSDAYKGTAVEQLVSGTRNMMSVPGFVKGDPDKAAKAIVKAVDQGHDYLRVPLGPDSVVALESKIGHLQKDLEATREIAISTDVD